jgi:Metallo-peptidase family M12B Reprolysin-like
MIALALWGTAALAQQTRFTPVNQNTVGDNFFGSRYKPASYKLFSLNSSAMQADLISAPSEKAVPASQSSLVVSLPTPEGMQRFRVVDAPVMEAGLAARYPGIKSFIGAGIDNPAATARFSMSPEGFMGMISAPEMATVYISPINSLYMVYARNEAGNRADRFNCLTPDVVNPVTATPVNLDVLRNADDGRLRSYRLAMCAAGEYSQFWLDGTETTDAQRKAKVLAAMNSQITRLNGIYERDFGVRLLLIANNDAIIYLNASTDPFSSGGWNSQTQSTCDGVIGSANYDIGHLVVRAANNGNAGCIGCVCTAGSKGSGWTAYQDLASDFFVVDYLTHEVGHQFGGNHTFTHSNEGTFAQCEPGSGSTIMGYAGITGATTDVQPHSDDYFMPVL